MRALIIFMNLVIGNICEIVFTLWIITANRLTEKREERTFNLYPKGLRKQRIVAVEVMA
jgi:hypothetical protein